MPILNLNVEDANVIVLQEGEYKLRILSAEVKTSKASNEYINLRCDVPAEPQAQDIYHTLMLPKGDDAKKDNSAKHRIKLFLKAFGLPTDNAEMDLDTFVGAEGFALLQEEEVDGGGTRNTIKKFLVSN
jgi:hypothetical protein